MAEIIIDFPHVFHPGTNQEENGYVLRHLLEFMIKVNCDYLARRPNLPSLYQSGVRYARTNEWLPIPALYVTRRGDCKSLAPALIAEMIVRRGIQAKPVFRWVEQANGTRNYHILVQTPNGHEDPSATLGMGRDEARWFY